MSEWAFRLSRHKGETSIGFYEVPLRWLIVERIAGPMLGHRLTDGFGNWLFKQADKHYKQLDTMLADDDVVRGIDPEWVELWGEFDEDA